MNKKKNGGEKEVIELFIAHILQPGEGGPGWVL
jgi:hypothetical protein